ncbi:hypothetical protein L9F63_013923, partial [Diploptera punctata]
LCCCEIKRDYYTLLHYNSGPLCNRHGTCALEDGEYHCVCSDGWAGLDCSIRLEMECSDEIDNDEDGMVDCSDSECCIHPSCVDNIMCLASNDPVEVLLRKQPPSVTASFYQRVKFLIEENSVQSYAHMDEYSERLAPQLMASPPQLTVAPAMPVFPLRPTPSPYSPYSPSRFHIDKRCQHRCSWKCCSIALILLSVALTAMLAYFGALSSMRPGMDSTSCILVEDAKAVAQDEEPRDLTSSQAPTEESLPTSTAVHSSGPSAFNKLPGGSGTGNRDTAEQPPQLASPLEPLQQHWPSVLEMRELGVPHSTTIPPFQFWNSEFRNK